MNIDIIFVTYNSQKWIERCLRSLENVKYPLTQISLNFVDNNSSDETKDIITNYNNKHLFGAFNFIPLGKNLGFGAANNCGFKGTSSKYVFFLNIDTELHPNAITELINNADSSTEDVALWECRQFPYEHPKIYNPVTLEITWASGAACMVRRDYFETVGMFDEKIFMYAEDVDLSWRFRAHGYKLKYLPKSIVYHYTYESAGEVKPNQFYNSTYNNLMLRYKFGTVNDIIKGYVMFSALYAVQGPSKNHKNIIVKKMVKSLFDGYKFRKWKRVNKQLNFQPEFKGWDYEIIRDGAFYNNKLPFKEPLVSILIRTCARPSVLREALISVRNQTYKNIEVVVVEDGPETAKKLIEDEFKDLNIVYKATSEKVGRCVVGNIAMELAKGEYFNFLDDDDVLFSDHVEVLCYQLLNSDFKAAYSIAFETPIQVISNDPYEYRELFHNVQHRQPFNRLMLLHHNFFPIQTVMFSREIYEDLGGIDPDLEVLEDWDLWLKYALKYDFLYVEKLTSVYRIPAVVNVTHERQMIFDKYLNIVREKHFNKTIELPIGHIFKDAEYLINRPQSIIYHVKQMGLKTFLFKVRNKMYSKLKATILKG